MGFEYISGKDVANLMKTVDDLKKRLARLSIVVTEMLNTIFVVLKEERLLTYDQYVSLKEELQLLKSIVEKLDSE